MAQHDYVIDNASGATVRADINSALSAIQTLNSGTSEPSSTAAGMLWLDTTGGAPYALKVRDAGNNHWLTLASVTDPGSDGNIETSATIKGSIDSTASFPTKSANSGNTSAGGHILQVQQIVKLDGFTTSSSSFIDVTGMSVKITPTSSSSKILVMIHLNYGGSVNIYGNAKVLRDSTVISTSTAASGNQINSTFAFGKENSSSAEYKLHLGCYNFLDSPSSTSELTYKLQVMTNDSTRTITVNRPYNYNDASYISGGTSSITVMEVS